MTWTLQLARPKVTLVSGRQVIEMFGVECALKTSGIGIVPRDGNRPACVLSNRQGHLDGSAPRGTTSEHT